MLTITGGIDQLQNPTKRIPTPGLILRYCAACATTVAVIAPAP